MGKGDGRIRNRSIFGMFDFFCDKPVRTRNRRPFKIRLFKLFKEKWDQLPLFSETDVWAGDGSWVQFGSEKDFSV
jgi:hypothetical protein